MPMCSSSRNIFWMLLASSPGLRLMPAKTTCVLEVTPTHAEPCFTASIAYSTWNRRPCGDHVVTSVS